ncbi:MAG: NAD-dependent epimerase/dehydratase family protein [Candidatus Diapherotrites archaeon]|nr:NAD-dependent epimerase/dehydratase family protein [Candidatus Diapherotrites archaeon]
MRKSILVTGSEGFSGKRVVRALRKKGYKVVEFDVEKGDDLLNYEQCKKASKNCYAVVHCAAILDEHSKALWNVNVLGTENIIRASAESKVKRFIFLSTAGVYGNVKGIANEQTEKKPQTKYEKSKAQAEEVVKAYEELIHITILRPAIVLGPNEYWRKIIKQIKKGFPLIGNGKNKWHAIYVNDVVDAIVFCLENESTASETLNVAASDVLTLEQLVLEIKKYLGLKPKVIKIPVWLGKLIAYLYITFSSKPIVTPEHVERLVRNRHYSIEKIKSFGWKPKVSTKEAIKKTLDELKPTL